VREREVQRQIRANDLRRAVLRLPQVGRLTAGPFPGVAQEFLQRLLGSMICFWLVGKALAFTVHVNPLYTFAVLGLLYSAHAAWVKYRLSADPNFRVRGCRCGGRRHEDTAKVHTSGESAILGVPNAVLGVVLYALLLGLQATGHSIAVSAVAAIAFCASAYLSYVMVARIGGLCGDCLNVGALNALILLHVFLGL